MIVPADRQADLQDHRGGGRTTHCERLAGVGVVLRHQSNVPFLDEQPDNPNSEINTANETWERTTKISGGYTLPFQVLMSATYERRNGEAQAPSAQFSGGQTITQIV